MYQNKFVVAVKVGRKILRESGDTVTIPFGSEYTILVKNLHTVRAKFRISIDGDPTDKAWFVANPNQSVEIERFSKDGDLARGRRFKFIERTSDIENHRGITADDGLIRVEYQIERPALFTQTFNYAGNWPNATPGNWSFGNYYNGQSQSGGVGGQSSGVTGSTVRSRTMALGALSKSAEFMSAMEPLSAQNQNNAYVAATQANETGITVAGSESNQRFVTVNDFLSGPSEAIVIRLRGRIHDTPVKVARIVKRPLTCTSCGKTSKSSAEFCSRCGTALIS